MAKQNSKSKKPAKGASQPAAPVPAPAGEKQPALEERIKIAEKLLPGLFKATKKKLSDYEHHQRAYEIVNAYVLEKRTTLSAADSKLVSAANFTDGSNYVPLLRKITSAYRSVASAESAVAKAKGDLGRARADKSEAVSKYNAARRELGAANKRVGTLISEAGKLKKRYASMEYGIQKFNELRASSYAELEEAVNSEKSYKALERTTLYDGKIETVATTWLREYVAQIRQVDGMIASIDKFAAYVNSIGAPKPETKKKK